jgi:tRNA(fMet)-specific endonuclease VapC
MRIASIALSRDLTLITGNVRHFARVPDLNVENWLARH